jgi:ferredoxin-type protein NapG
VNRDEDGNVTAGARGIENDVGNGEHRTTTGLNSPVTRRALLGLGGQALILVALGGFVRLFGDRYNCLRPPGALPAEEFLSRCIKCQKCLEVCPTGAITSVLLTETVLGAGSPQLDFEAGYCDLCMKCIEVCPTGALRPIDKDTARLGVAEVDRESCVAWIWRGCTKCYEECPLDAIVLDDYQRPAVDAAKCNGCGLCEYVCISSAVRSYSRSRGKGIVVLPTTAEGTRETDTFGPFLEENATIWLPRGEA